MSAALPTSFPPRTGHAGPDVFSAVVAIVRNRTGEDFTTAFNNTLRGNEDLMKPSYGNLDTAMNLGRLLNRVECRSGLSAVESTEFSAAHIAALTNRFAPHLAGAPTAMQWDVLWRAALELERAGVPDRLFNRAPEGVKESDWKKANDQANEVFAILVADETQPIDRGPYFERRGQVHPGEIRGCFKGAITRLMGKSIDPKYPGNLSRQQAFDWLKEDEPIFWTMAMLSFEP
jgi:hypothetical protein